MKQKEKQGTPAHPSIDDDESIRINNITIFISNYSEAPPNQIEYIHVIQTNMKVAAWRLNVVIIILAAVVLVRFVNCNGFHQAGSGWTSGAGRLLLVDGYAIPYPSNYYLHLATHDGNATVIAIKDVVSRGDNRNRHRELFRQKQVQQQRQHQQQLATIAKVSPPPPPTKIVRQGGMFVEFAMQKNTTTRFASATSSATAGFDVVTNNPTTVLHIFTKLATDKLSSEGFSSANADDLPDEIPTKARCGGAEESFAVVRAYAQFDNAHNCCHGDSGTSPSTVIEYTFQLICLPTCNNPIEQLIDISTNGFSEYSDTSSITPSFKVKPSTAHVGPSEPLQKQNRVKGPGAATNAGAGVYVIPVTNAVADTNAARISTSAHQTNWNKMYERLVAYKNEHNGDTKVPYRYDQDPQLGKWASKQRRAHKNGKMPTDRASLLNSIDFDWGERSKWDDMYQRLVAYKSEHNGNTNVPYSYDQDPQLGEWVSTQRKAYRSAKMTTERASLLNSLGFDWGSPRNEHSWDEMYQRLVAYKNERGGDTNVPHVYDQDPQLGKWVISQRQAQKNTKMSVEHVSLLDSIGFDWGVPQRDWDKMYQQLIMYKRKHGDTKVPRRYDQDPQLGEWVSTQRMTYKKKKMPGERASLLNSVGFDWEARSSSWEEMYQRLVAYKIKHNGDTKVPQKYQQDPQLGEWVFNQRRAYRNTKMSTERASLLNSIDFDWGVPQKEGWNEMFLRLIAYQSVHSDTKVPVKYAEDPQLGRWVSKQRAVYKKKKMLDERVNLLNSIGFDWSAPKRDWDDMYQRLIAYKIDHSGDTKVPQNYVRDPELGQWVKNQRTAYNKSKMPMERASLLNSIGFDWEAISGVRANLDVGGDAGQSNPVSSAFASDVVLKKKRN